MAQEMITITNGGRPVSGPKVLPDGDLQLDYVNGQMCIDNDNTSKPFSVTVLLHCANTAEVRTNCSISTVGYIYQATLHAKHICGLLLQMDLRGLSVCVSVGHDRELCRNG